MAKILLVEDDEHFREALSLTLKDANHTVVTATNGKVARDILGTQVFNLIISDVQMPFCGGLELLEWVKQNQPTKFILMTGFSHLLETKDAFARGADDFLTKPFKVEDLKRCLQNHLPKSPHAESPLESKGVSFCKVSIDEFVARPTIDFDVYIRLSEKKYVKIGHAGALLPKDQIEKYKSHGEHFLYIPADSFSKLLSSNIEIAKAMKGSRIISKEKKMGFLKHTGEVLLEKVFVDGIDKDVLRDSSDYLKLSVQSIAENADSVDLIELMQSHSDKIYAQCVSTSLYSIMIARKMGITASQTFFKLAMGGLFHEVGLKEVDRDIINKPRPLLTLAERKLFESHTRRGEEILMSMGTMPSDVIQFVLEHHEDQTGTGYPRGLKKQQQHPLSCIIQLAVLFSETVLRNKSGDKSSGPNAIKYIEENYLERVDAKCFTALKGIFSV